MKNLKWRGLGLLVLIILLGIGLSYLALNETPTETTKNKEEQTMSIALVNEDEGTMFNDSRTILGDDFTNGIHKNSKHEWFVVSRGVAESGIDRGVYDMMILIPTNFSDRSLSFHSERPEPVALHYKINATGHDDVRAAAEKTAGNILADFNKKLVNVYFASIIGNLQDAQDNISEMIEKERIYTNEYKNEINNPLSNYTDQFSMVQNHTETSKNSYQSLEDVLDAFQTSLDDDVHTNQEFASEMASVIEMKDEKRRATEAFSEFFDQFSERMRSQDVTEQLASLQRQNDAVYQQFQRYEDQRGSIVDDSDTLKSQFSAMNETMAAYKEDLEENLDVRLKEIIEERFADKDVDESYTNTMRQLFENLDSNVKGEISRHIERLPMLSMEAIEKSELAGATKSDVKRIAGITNQYIEEDDLDINQNDKDIISEEIQKIKQSLVYDGLTVKDKVVVPEDVDNEEGETKRLFFTVPKAFKITGISINGEKVSYNAEKGIDVSGYDNGLELRIAMYLNPKYLNDKFDIYAPVQWEWKVVQKGKTDASEDGENPETDDIVQTTNTFGDFFNQGKHPLVAINNSADEVSEDSEDSSIGEPSDSSNSEENLDEDADDGNTEDDDLGSQEEGPESDGDEDADGEAEEPSENNPNPYKEDSNSGEGGAEDGSNEGDSGETEPNEIIVTNNYVYKKVQSPIELNVTERIINKNAEMVRPYYALQSLFELYYGFDLNGTKAQKSNSDETELKDNATDDSLYHFIHNNNVEEILRNYLVNTVKDDIQFLMGDLRTDIDDYIGALDQASMQSNKLAEKVAETRENSNRLNDRVHQLLEELSVWRETNQELMDGKNSVVSNDGEMQTAIMGLDSQYQPLLLSSEALKNQANSNFEMAGNVYDTFEAIDNQAEEIKQSGTTIIARGNELAEDLTQKYMDDANFAENFNEVLDNSRIGDRQNNDLYQFLSNPVHTKNNGIIMSEEESLSPYFLVIVLFIASLFTGYVIHSINERRLATVDGEGLFIMNNLPISSITAGIGLVIGLVIGLASFYFLQLSQAQIYAWVGLIVILMMMLLFLATYLLRQFKTVGMFILLAIFGLYLLVTKTLGFHFENKGAVQAIQKVSPLQYAENVLSTVLVDNSHIPFMILALLVLFAGIGYVLNLLVYRKSKPEKEMEEGSASEAN